MEAWQSLVQIVTNLLFLLRDLIDFLVRWWAVLLWLAWALWAVNWRKTWPVLARGGWAPLVLSVVLIALAWSQIVPSEDLALPNFWWQLGVVSLVAALTLFCGWLQGVCGWTPPDIELEPPPATAGHDGHGHH